MSIAAVTCPSPVGLVTSTVDGGAALKPAPGRDTASRWSNDDMDVELVVGRPSYPDVVFAVDEHIGWRWRVVVRRDIAALSFHTHVHTGVDDVAAADEPLDVPWVCGVLWTTPTHIWGVGTADRDALLIRHAESGWLPQRFVEDEDPMRPGMSGIITRSATGISARFDSLRAGEMVEHTAVMAWRTGSARAQVVDALDVDGDSIARGALSAANDG